MRLSLTALWSDFLIGSVSYTLEDVGIRLNSGCHGNETKVSGPRSIADTHPPNVPQAILEQTGDHVYNRFGATLAYDTATALNCPITASARN